MDEAKEETPADRIRAAIAGMPAIGLAQVLAGDVAAVAAGVPEERHSPRTRALARGVAVTADQTDGDGEPIPRRVFQEAGKLAELLEAAGADPR